MFDRSHCRSLNASEAEAGDSNYSGIPISILLNTNIVLFFVAWFSLCRFFCSLSDKTLVDKNGWFQFIYGERNMGILHPFRRIKRNHRHEYESWMLNFINRKLNHFDEDQPNKIVKHKKQLERLGYLYLGYWKISLEDVLDHCGRDAYLYLRAQQKFIILMTLVSLMSVSLLAPVNYYINYDNNVLLEHYRRTLLTYSVSHHSVKYMHVLVTIIISLLNVTFALAIYLDRTEPIPENNNVVLIKNIPDKLRDHEELRKYLCAHFSSEFSIQQIFLTYDLSKVKDDLQDARCTRLLLENPKLSEAQRREIESFEDKTLAALNMKFAEILKYPAHVIFVRFTRDSDASLFIELHKMQKMYAESHKGTSLFKQISPHSGWVLQLAPNPWDIHWDSCAMEHNAETCRRYSLYVLLFFIFFCLTTPVICLSHLKEVLNLLHITPGNFGIVTVFGIRFNFAAEFSSWLLILVTCFLPKIVTYLARSIPANFYTTRELNILKFTLAFLVIAILIFPSLGLVSLDFLVRQFVHNRADVTLESKCFFSPESGTFFLHYLLSGSAFVWLDIARIGELFEYGYYLLIYCKSGVEHRFAPFRCRFQFFYSRSFAVNFLMIYISFAYAISCPLIMVFGLMWLLSKHIVDRINIYTFNESVDLLSEKMEHTIARLSYYPSLFMLIQVFLTFAAYDHMSSIPVMLIGLWLLAYLYIIFVKREQIEEWAKNTPNRRVRRIFNFLNR